MLFKRNGQHAVPTDVKTSLPENIEPFNPLFIIN
jgi:hypothetical protein